MSNDEMTMRDQFAMAALQGMLANAQIAKSVTKYSLDFTFNQEWHANASYAFADAMLKERDRHRGEMTLEQVMESMTQEEIQEALGVNGTT